MNFIHTFENNCQNYGRILTLFILAKEQIKLSTAVAVFHRGFWVSVELTAQQIPHIMLFNVRYLVTSTITTATKLMNYRWKTICEWIPLSKIDWTFFWCAMLSVACSTVAAFEFTEQSNGHIFLDELSWTMGTCHEHATPYLYLCKHKTLTQSWVNVGPASQTVSQHWTNLG